MLTLPPRRELPPDVADRMLTRVLAGLAGPPAGRFNRIRGPLAVAAGVTVLAGGAMIVAQSTHGANPDPLAAVTTRTTSPTHTSTQRGHRPTSSRQPSLTIKPTALPIPPLEEAKAREDLDRCAHVVSTSSRAAEFAPRAGWQPVYAIELNGHRITAYREPGGKPMFCDTTASTAAVSDPTAPPMPMMADVPGATVRFHGLYVSPAGVLAGVTEGASKLECDVNVLLTPNGGFNFSTRKEIASLKDNLFVVHIGILKDGDEIVSTAYDMSGKPGTSGGFRFERARVRPVGAAGNA